MQFKVKAYGVEGKTDKKKEVQARHMEELRKLGEHFICEGGCLEEDGKVKSCELFWILRVIRNLMNILLMNPTL